LNLIEWLKHSWINKKLIFPFGKTEQEKFELGKKSFWNFLGIEHEVTIENVVLSEENSKAFLLNLGIELAPKGVPSVKEDVNTSGKSLLKVFF